MVKLTEEIKTKTRKFCIDKASEIILKYDDFDINNNNNIEYNGRKYNSFIPNTNMPCTDTNNDSINFIIRRNQFEDGYEDFSIYAWPIVNSMKLYSQFYLYWVDNDLKTELFLYDEIKIYEFEKYIKKYKYF